MNDTVERLHEKIAELTTKLLDVAEANNVHILVCITVVDGDDYKGTMGSSAGFPHDKMMLATLSQSEKVYSALTK